MHLVKMNVVVRKQRRKAAESKEHVFIRAFVSDLVESSLCHNAEHGYMKAALSG